jgi:hypothetical protein
MQNKVKMKHLYRGKMDNATKLKALINRNKIQYLNHVDKILSFFNLDYIFKSLENCEMNTRLYTMQLVNMY